jgi:hypothetical protein
MRRFPVLVLVALLLSGCGVLSRRLLAAYNYQDLLLHNLLQAGDSGRLTKVKAVLKKLEINGVSLKSRAYDLDLKTCAKE